MAVANSLANRQTRSSMATYMSQEAVRKQINSVVGGKNATRFRSTDNTGFAGMHEPEYPVSCITR